VREDAEWLKRKLLNAALRGDAKEAGEDEYDIGRSWTSVARDMTAVSSSAAAGLYGEARISLG